MKNTTSQPADGMTEEDYRAFIIGIRQTIDVNGLDQKEVAIRAGVNHVNFNKVLNHRTGSSAKYRHKICEVLGVTVEDMIRIGSPAQQPVPQIAAPFPVTIPKDYMPTDEVVQYVARVSASLSDISAAYAKIDARLKYWQQLFETMPVPVVVLRDGLVYNQNRRSRAIWDGLGRSLCSGCRDEKCKEYDCNIKDAIDKGKDIEVYKMIGDDYYKVIATHFSANNHEYTTIVITPIAECKTAMEKLTQIADERAFLESNQYEAAEYYADANRRVSYCNKSFLRLFEIERDDIKTTDDFHILLSRKLFYFQHVAKAADEVREFKRSAEVQAKLTNNKTVHFIFRPHLKDGELQGVLVMVLTPELYECFQ